MHVNSSANCDYVRIAPYCDEHQGADEQRKVCKYKNKTKLNTEYLHPCFTSDVSEMDGAGQFEDHEEGEPTTKRHRIEGETGAEMSDLEGEDGDDEEEDQEGSDVQRGRGRG